MSFRVLYAENSDLDWLPIEQALRKHNKAHPLARFEIERAKTPEELKKKLNGKFKGMIDLIMADIYFDDPDTGEFDADERLSDIIKYVKDAGETKYGSKPLPIIGLTGYGPSALESCLERRDDLFDIWDKNTASPEYIVWRLSKLPSELSFIRPDALLQREIKGINEGGTGWHEHVVDMVERYQTGWTEQDQIKRVGEAINNIAHMIGAFEQSKVMWKTMLEWESLSRAVSPKVRGHARHVINVFWLGYYLIHHKLLRNFFAQTWKGLIEKRAEMQNTTSIPSLDAVSNTWFFASLFHDVGGCIEKASVVNIYLSRLLKPFGILSHSILNLETTDKISEELKTLKEKAKRELLERANDLFYEFSEPLKNHMRAAFDRSVMQDKPDQGIIAALHLRQLFPEGALNCYAREAGRAASLHNLFPTLAGGTGTLPVSWEKEPIACLLILCDQIQTWDRERGDQTLWDDTPSRAELIGLRVEQQGANPHIEMSINYIAPPHLAHSRELYHRVKDDLNLVLLSHPDHALHRIQKPWPFTFRVNCFLSGDPLVAKMNLG